MKNEDEKLLADLLAIEKAGLIQSHDSGKEDGERYFNLADVVALLAAKKDCGKKRQKLGT